LGPTRQREGLIVSRSRVFSAPPPLHIVRIAGPNMRVDF